MLGGGGAPIIKEGPTLGAEGMDCMHLFFEITWNCTLNAAQLRYPPLEKIGVVAAHLLPAATLSCQNLKLISLKS